MDKNEEVEVEENLDLPEIKEGEEDSTDWKVEAQKLREKAIAQRERTKALKQKLAEATKAVGVVAASKEVSKSSNTGELDETQLDYLDLKGVSESEDIEVIESVIKKTGMTVRQALKDDYVLKKLEANKQEREVKGATPSSTKRSGSQSNDIAAAIAKFEQTNQLPDDFETRTAVVNAIVEKGNSNKPSWK